MSNRDTHQRNQGYFFPILLILIGAVLLAHNLELLPGRGWDIVVDMWPALLIAAGIDDLLRRHGIAWPVLLIGSGALLLIHNYSSQVYVTWTEVIQLWPLILIAVGIDLIFRSRTWWTTMISIVLVILFVGGAVWWLAFPEGINSGAADEIYQGLRQGTERATISYELRAGTMILEGSEKEGLLSTGTVYPAQPRETVHTMGDRMTYTLEGSFPVIFPHLTQWEWTLSPQIPLTLIVENGAGELFLALEDLDLEDLTVEQGAGRMVLHLPQKVSGVVSIDQAVGHIQLVVSPQSAVSVAFDRGISRLDVPEGYERKGERMYSPGIKDREDVIEIHVEQAIGVIALRESGE